jgi:hypothetical protein
VAEAERRLAADGIVRVEVSALVANAGALRLYERLGYAPSFVTLARAVAPGTGRAAGGGAEEE